MDDIDNVRLEAASTLASLCQVSKRFCAIALPLLYHSISNRSGHGRACQIRTLRIRPDLARLVKEAGLCTQNDQDKTDYADELEQTARRAGVSIQRGYDKNEYAGSERGDPFGRSVPWPRMISALKHFSYDTGRGDVDLGLLLCFLPSL